MFFFKSRRHSRPASTAPGRTQDQGLTARVGTASDTVETAHRDVTRPTFKQERLEAIGRIEPHHFWFHGRRRLVRSVLRDRLPGGVRTIADIGCGTGFNLKAWMRFGDRILLLDRLPAEAGVAEQSCGASWRVRGDVCALPLRETSIDAVIALDVLEHVPMRWPWRSALGSCVPEGCCS